MKSWKSGVTTASSEILVIDTCVSMWIFSPAWILVDIWSKIAVSFVVVEKIKFPFQGVLKSWISQQRKANEFDCFFFFAILICIDSSRRHFDNPKRLRHMFRSLLNVSRVWWFISGSRFYMSLSVLFSSRHSSLSMAKTKFNASFGFVGFFIRFSRALAPLFLYYRVPSLFVR